MQLVTIDIYAPAAVGDVVSGNNSRGAAISGGYFFALFEMADTAAAEEKRTDPAADAREETMTQIPAAVAAEER